MIVIYMHNKLPLTNSMMHVVGGAGGLEAKSQDWRVDAIGWAHLQGRGKHLPPPATNNTARLIAH